MRKRFFLAPVVLTPLVAVENVPAQTVRLNPPAKIYRDKIEANWFTRGNDTNNAFWYRLNLAEGKREFVLVDAVRGTRQPAFDHARVAAALAQLLNRAVEAANLPVESIEFDRDGKTIFLHGAADWKLDLESYTVTPRGEVAMEKSLPANSRIHPSRDCGEETQIIFVNHLKEEVNVFWVDGGVSGFPTAARCRMDAVNSTLSRGTSGWSRTAVAMCCPCLTRWKQPAPPSSGRRLKNLPNVREETVRRPAPARRMANGKSSSAPIIFSGAR